MKFCRLWENVQSNIYSNAAIRAISDYHRALNRQKWIPQGLTAVIIVQVTH